MKATKKNIGGEERRQVFIYVFVIVVVLGCLVCCYLLGVRWASYKPSDHRTSTLVQKAQEKQREGFQSYLQQSTAPKNDQQLSQLIKDKYQTSAGYLGEDADYVVGHGMKDGELYIDMVTSRTYTLPAAGGLTNENRTFIMCTRLIGKPSLTAQVRSVDVPCAEQLLASPSSEPLDAPILVKLAQ